MTYVFYNFQNFYFSRNFSSGILYSGRTLGLGRPLARPWVSHHLTTLQLSLEILRGNAWEHGGDTYAFKVGRSAVGTRARRGNLDAFCELFLDQRTRHNNLHLQSRESNQPGHAMRTVVDTTSRCPGNSSNSILLICTESPRGSGVLGEYFISALRRTIRFCER